MFTLLPLGCLTVAAVLLIVLAVIDLREYLLLDKYVFPFGLLGLAFHASMGFTLQSPAQLLIGAVVGGGILLIVRYFGNMHYKQESLGLGDVKLLAAAGLWLGGADVTFAMTIGAAAGLLHGLGVALYRTLVRRQAFNMTRLMIPAGPGFIVGIVVVIVYSFGSAIIELVERLPL